jgi:uncharacterized damage-inducible protein DinB
MKNDAIQKLVRSQEEILRGENWLGNDFRQLIDGLTEEQAFAKPLPELHSTAELISHLRAWRRAGLQRFRGETPSLRIESPENWKNNETLRREGGWQTLKDTFYREAAEMAELLNEKDDSFLEQTLPDGHTFRQIAEGLIQHDIYHMAQIAVTLKFAAARG